MDGPGPGGRRYQAGQSLEETERRHIRDILASTKWVIEGSKGAAAVLTIDSDGQHDPAFAPAIVGALDRADIVIGTRDLSGKAVPKHRRIANMISSAATRAVSGGKVRDSQSGYRAIKAEVLRKIHAVGDRYEFETDFIIRAARAGFTTVNVPISTIYGSPSYFREFRDAWLVIKVLWRHRAGIFKR